MVVAKFQSEGVNMRISIRDEQGRVHFSANARDLCVHLAAMDHNGPIAPSTIQGLTVDVYEEDKLIASESAGE